MKLFLALVLASVGIGNVFPTQARAENLIPKVAPWMRLDSNVANLKLDPKGHAAAYTNETGDHLRVVDLKTGDIWKVTRRDVGGSFFWAPDGYRLFYRVLRPGVGNSPRTEIFAFDRALRKSIPIDKVGSSSGFLTFDPRDFRMQLLHDKGILSKRLVFPDERLARWQSAQRADRGRWLVAQNGVLWLTQSGYGMRQLEGTPPGKVLSFDVSPDGHAIAWATPDERIWMSRDGEPAKFVAFGRDPAWHPQKPLLAFAGAHMVGKMPVAHDLRVSDEKGSMRWLTNTQNASERWPQWHPDGKRIVYTQAQSADLFTLDLEP